MRISFLGLGQMGASLARLLLERGHDLTVWNRTPAAAEPLVKAGAAAAVDPRTAVAEADLVFTMLLNDKAVEDILFDQNTLAAIPKGATHVSLSTISPALAGRLTREHAAHQQQFVSSPVFGRPAVAAEGKLWLVIAGPDPAITPILPILESFCRGYTIVGTKPSAANAVKVAGNFLITAMIASLAESATYAEANGLDGALFLETVNSALFQSPFYASYSKLVLDAPEQIGATVELGAKDMRLFQEAARTAGIRTPLADIFQRTLDEAIAAGLGGADWANGYYQYTQRQSKNG